jgi:hypothetical protein
MLRPGRRRAPRTSVIIPLRVGQVKMQWMEREVGEPLPFY